MSTKDQKTIPVVLLDQISIPPLSFYSNSHGVESKLVMGTVHRNSLPPKNLRHHYVLRFPDYEFNEDHLINWAKTYCQGHMQYDFIRFEGPNRFAKVSIDLKVWFEKKQDAVLFREHWIAEDE